MKHETQNEYFRRYLKAVVGLAALLLIAGFYLQGDRGGKVPMPAQLPNAVPISSGTAAADAPYVTKNSNGQPVLCWIEGKNKSMMYYAVLNEKGTILHGPKAVPPSEGLSPHNEMMPKMVFKPDGEIIAVWPVDNPSPDNKYAGLIYYSRSSDGGDSWSEPFPITREKSSNDQRYFDLALLPDGNAAVVWLDDRYKYHNEGSTLFFAATDGNSGFQNEKVIGRSTCQCCRTDIYVDHHGNINVVYRNIFGKQIRDMAYTVSYDLGQTFSEPKRISEDNWEIAGCPHTGPSMTSDGNALHFYWYTMGGGEGVYCTSTTNYGKHFVERKLFGKKARHPQVTATGGMVAVVWDELFRTGNKVYTRIGLSLRKEGNGEEKYFLTPPNIQASYPVVSGLSNNRLLVAWSQKKNEKRRHIYYSLIDVSAEYASGIGKRDL